MNVLVRGMSTKIHQRLKLKAEKHHRPLGKEILSILEREAMLPSLEDAGPPTKVGKGMSWDELAEAVREGRR